MHLLRSLGHPLAVLMLGAWAATATAQVGPGDPAPDFTLPDLAGVDHTLSEQRGRVVLLALIGFACQPCINSAPSVEAIWQDYRDTGNLVVWALDMWNGSPTDVQSYVDLTHVTYPVLRLAGFLQSNAFFGIPFDNYVVIDPQGIVRYTSVNEAFGAFNDSAIRAAIDAWLPVAVEEETWSQVKGLYR